MYKCKSSTLLSCQAANFHHFIILLFVLRVVESLHLHPVNVKPKYRNSQVFVEVNGDVQYVMF